MNLPPPMPPSQQMFQDEEHLKLLAIFHYVLAGLTLLGVLFGGFYMMMGVMFMRTFPAMASSNGQPPPPEMANFGWFFILIGGAISLVCITLTVCKILAAKWMSERKNRTFCLVIAGIECLNIPLGTALGVFTFLVLSRPSVAALFEANTGLTTPHA